MAKHSSGCSRGYMRGVQASMWTWKLQGMGLEATAGIELGGHTAVVFQVLQGDVGISGDIEGTK